MVLQRVIDGCGVVLAGQHEDDALEHGEVALEDREVHQVTGPRPREHGFHQNRAAELEPELEAEDGEDLRRRVPHDVREDHAAPEALGAEREHELLGEDVERRRTHDAREDAERDQRERDRRQCHVSQVLDGAALRRRAHRGQPVELHGEDDDEDDAGPVVGNGHADDGDGAHELVEDAPLPERGEEPDRDPDPEGEERG